MTRKQAEAEVARAREFVLSAQAALGRMWDQCPPDDLASAERWNTADRLLGDAARYLQ